MSTPDVAATSLEILRYLIATVGDGRGLGNLGLDANLEGVRGPEDASDSYAGTEGAAALRSAEFSAREGLTDHTTPTNRGSATASRHLTPYVSVGSHP